MIVINLVLFIGLMLLARDLQSLVSNGFNDFCVHRSLNKERSVHTYRHIPLNPPLNWGTLIQIPPFLRGVRGDKNTVKANSNTSV